MRRAPILLASLLLSSLSGIGTAVALDMKVGATFEPASVTLDRTASLRVRLEAPEPVTVDMPDLPDVDQQWTVQGRALLTPEKATVPSRVWEQRYELQPEDVGTLDLPILELTVRRGDGTVERVELRAPPLRVVSLLPDEPSRLEPKDIARPVALTPLSRPPWGWLGLACVAAGAYVVIQRRRQGGDGGAAPPPPRETAMLALDRLATLDLAEPGRAAAIVTATTEIVREFLEAERGLPATRRTSEELDAIMPTGEGALAGQRAGIAALLTLADGVKFARAPATAAMAEEALSRARAIVGEAGGEPVPAPT